MKIPLLSIFLDAIDRQREIRQIKGEPRMLSQQLKWLLQQLFEGADLGLRHFLEVSSIYFRRKLLFWDFKKDLVDLHPIF